VERGICKRCERFFIKDHKNQDVCEKCYQKEREEYETVKDYLFQNKGASIMNVYLDTKVPIKTIERFIREEKITIVDTNT
jgi:hypothetical protein